MNIRITISFLCAGAAALVAFACGPRSHSDPAAVASTKTAKQAAKTVAHTRRGKDGPVREPKLDSRLNVDVHANEVRFALNVANVGTKYAELSFPTGKSYDFVVVDSLGREVWHWSSGRIFTQGVQNKQLDTGDAMSVAEAWKPLQAGRYTAIATLNSSNFPQEQRAEFVVR